MKHALFSFVGHLFSNLISKLKEISEVSLFIVGKLNNVLLKLIDPDKYNHVKSSAQQSHAINELVILQNLMDIKEEAQQIGQWSLEHQDKLNFFATLLYNEYDWEEEDLQRYFSEFILAGPELEAEE